MFRRKNKHSADRQARMGPKSMSTPTVNSDLVDRKTKQKLFFECNVCVLGQERLRSDERFNQTKAEVLMNRMYDKRQSHCILYCLEDNIRFQKSKLLGSTPKRNFVRYGCIKHVFLFEDKPDVMMLCIDSGRSDRRTYEAFKFKSKENVLTVCEYIYKATQDPDYVLRNLTPIRELSRLSDSSIPVHYRSVSEIEQPLRQAPLMTTRSVHSPPTRVTQSYATEDRDALNSSRKLQSTAREAIDSSSLDVHYMPLKTRTDFSTHGTLDKEELHGKLCRRMDDDDWEVNVTYLQWDNERGATINDRGPIYMYVARRLRVSQ